MCVTQYLKIKTNNYLSEASNGNSVAIVWSAVYRARGIYSGGPARSDRDILRFNNNFIVKFEGNVRRPVAVVTATFFEDVRELGPSDFLYPTISKSGKQFDLVIFQEIKVIGCSASTPW